MAPDVLISSKHHETGAAVRATMGTADATEGMMAFLEMRSPVSNRSRVADEPIPHTTQDGAHDDQR